MKRIAKKIITLIFMFVFCVNAFANNYDLVTRMSDFVPAPAGLVQDLYDQLGGGMNMALNGYKAQLVAELPHRRAQLLSQDLYSCMESFVYNKLGADDKIIAVYYSYLYHEIEPEKNQTNVYDPVQGIMYDSIHSEAVVSGGLRSVYIMTTADNITFKDFDIADEIIDDNNATLKLFHNDTLNLEQAKGLLAGYADAMKAMVEANPKGGRNINEFISLDVQDCNTLRAYCEYLKNSGNSSNSGNKSNTQNQYSKSNASSGKRGRWAPVGDDWYYYNADGNLVKDSLQIINDKLYYFDADGIMAKDTTIDVGGKTYNVDDKGVCKPE